MSTAHKRLSRPEFIAGIAMLFATIAFTIDAMLPALPDIGRELSPLDLNKAQLIVTSFVLGMGVGTFFTGPLSDAWGRRPIILGGAAIYICASFVAWQAQNLEVMLAARFFQGLGAAGPRVASVAIVRDLYEGRQMAKIMSFVMMVFMLVPTIAPTLGAGIIAISSWRGIFVAYILFSIATASWVFFRQGETHPVARRTPLKAKPLWAAIREVFSHKMVLYSIFLQVLLTGNLFAALSSTQQIFDVTFSQGHNFHLWFGFIAILASTASMVNAALVVRFGMRKLASIAIGGQLAYSLIMLIMTWQGWWPEALYFPAYVLWQISVFFMVGMTAGNINALAMEPVGHIAGMAASIISAVATIFGAMIAIPIGLMFNGTPLPLITAVTCTGLLSFFAIRAMSKLERKTT
ncbi:MAG: multidrug effflux MFS transporter [Halocynthiibacter sp.]